MHLLEHSPRFALEQAADIVCRLYGLKGSVVSELPSERDQNFLIDTSDGRAFVLKIANALEEPAFLDAQNQVLARLGQEVSFCPRVVPSRDGVSLMTVPATDGKIHRVRLVTYLAGVPLGRL